MEGSPILFFAAIFGSPFSLVSGFMKGQSKALKNLAATDFHEEDRVE